MHGNIPNYIGNCTNVLDTTDIWQDATELAQFVENSNPYPIEKISQMLPKKFYAYIEKNQSKYDCGINGDIVWVYNSEIDIHYFFHKDITN